MLERIGPAGQERLEQARIAVVGAGGLGCSALRTLCATGIGHIRLLDGDVVEESNLARQALYGPADIGQRKVQAAIRALQRINPDVELDGLDCFVNEENAMEALSGVDLILDCTDNHRVRYLIDDTAHLLHIPVVYAALHQFQGQLAVFHSGGGTRFRHLYPNEQQLTDVPNCAASGVYSALPAIMGQFQANEALKVLLGIGKLVEDRLLVYDSLNNEMHTYRIQHEEHI